MRELFRTFPLMCVVLLVPIIPFLFFGSQLEHWLRNIAEDPPSQWATAGLVVGLLSTDILLPIPSSVISTLSGVQLGWWKGTLSTWLGMNLGATIGFALARKWGHRFAAWFSKPQDLERMRPISDRYGPMVLVLTRALPVFAEASVLISGIHRLSWRRFLVPVVFSNLGIALGYAAFGDYANQNQSLALALGFSVAAPVLVAALARRWMPTTPPA